MIEPIELVFLVAVYIISFLLGIAANKILIKYRKRKQQQRIAKATIHTLDETLAFFEERNKEEAGH